MTDLPLPTSRRVAPRDPLVGAWLGLICVLVVAMIVVGAATRLTDSGLSITEWNLAKGLWPPTTPGQWAEEFALYRQTTEYQVQNAGMSLAEFQNIYAWEWGHRFLGKMMGLVFAIPFLIFWATGRMRGRFWQVLALFALGGAQGAIGWWMVASGLEGRVDVSPIRLAVHLGMAFLILGLALRLALAAFVWPRLPSRVGTPRAFIWLFVALLFGQILLGALAAGADAGRAFSDWPKIGGSWVPTGWALWPIDLEDRAILQFNHRMAGYAVCLAALLIALRALWRGRGPARGVALAVGALAALQAALGVVTIVTGAHLHVSLAHQIGAILLWAAAIALTRSAAWR